MQRTECSQGAKIAQAPVSRPRQSEPFMTVKEAARTFKVSEMTIRRAYSAGDIPCVTFGRSCRVLRAFVLSVIATAEAGQQVAVEEFGRQWKAAHSAAAPAEAVA